MKQPPTLDHLPTDKRNDISELDMSICKSIEGLYPCLLLCLTRGRQQQPGGERYGGGERKCGGAKQSGRARHDGFERQGSAERHSGAEM